MSRKRHIVVFENAEGNYEMSIVGDSEFQTIKDTYFTVFSVMVGREEALEAGVESIDTLLKDLKTLCKFRNLLENAFSGLIEKLCPEVGGYVEYPHMPSGEPFKGSK